MGYGNTYGSCYSPSKKLSETLFERFLRWMESIGEKNEEKLTGSLDGIISSAGFHRDEIDRQGKTELETKLDLFPQSDHTDFFGLLDSLNLKDPYSKGKILDKSTSSGDLYMNTLPTIDHAFTLVESKDKVKIKEKGKAQYIARGDITLIERLEQEVSYIRKGVGITAVAQRIDNSRQEIQLLGTIVRENKELFVLNNHTGRIFVVESHFAYIKGNRDNHLMQLEVEYYGRLHGNFPPKPHLYDDIAGLTSVVMKDLPRLGYDSKSSALTKFDWVRANVHQ